MGRCVVTNPPVDAGAGPDAGRDAGDAPDAGGADAGLPDAGAGDAGRDAGAFDAGPLDGGVTRPDAGLRDGGCTLSFAPLTTQAGGGPFVLTDDFDLDGRPDLAWTNPFGDELGVVLNSPVGLRIAVVTRFPAGAWPGALASTDVDLDGFPDLVVGAFFSSQLVVARNDGLGRFTLSTTYPLANVWWITAAPLDTAQGDELVVANQLSDVLVLRNTGGALAMPNPWSTDGGLGVFGNCTGDLRGVGRHDVVALSGLSPGLATVLRNDGNARFTVADQLPIPGRPFACRVGDLDRDGFADLVVTTQDETLELFRGTSVGRLAPFATLTGLKSETPPALGDLDLDGQPELVVSSSVADGGVFVVRAFADGGLSTPARLQPAPSSVGALVMTDLDGDGLLDVAGVANGQTFVMRNTCR